VPSGGVLELVELPRTVLAPNAYAIIAGLRMVRQAGLPEMTPWFGGRQEEAVRCISFSRETHADHLADRILGDVRKIRLPLFLVVVRELVRWKNFVKPTDKTPAET